MSTAHDIYNPPPAPEPLAPPPPDPIAWTSSDLVMLGALIVLALIATAWAWTIEPSLAFLVLIGGAIVITESWSTALGFLHRQPTMGAHGRWRIYVAALVPYVLGLGLATALMMGLFHLLDRLS